MVSSSNDSHPTYVVNPVYDKMMSTHPIDFEMELNVQATWLF